MIMKNRGMNNTVNNRNSCTQSYNCVCFYPVIVRPLYIPNTQTHEHARAPGWNAHIAVAKLAATTNLQTHVLYVTSDVIVDLSIFCTALVSASAFGDSQSNVYYKIPNIILLTNHHQNNRCLP